MKKGEEEKLFTITQFLLSVIVVAILIGLILDFYFNFFFIPMYCLIYGILALRKINKERKLKGRKFALFLVWFGGIIMLLFLINFIVALLVRVG
jgi:hypothetical protein